jgi:hypothetical protein
LGACGGVWGHISPRRDAHSYLRACVGAFGGIRGHSGAFRDFSAPTPVVTVVPITVTSFPRCTPTRIIAASPCQTKCAPAPAPSCCYDAAPHKGRAAAGHKVKRRPRRRESAKTAAKNFFFVDRRAQPEKLTAGN